jgi:hypothetical protein
MTIRPAVAADSEFILNHAERVIAFGDVRAREFYTKLGFAEEWIRCIKRL